VTSIDDLPVQASETLRRILGAIQGDPTAVGFARTGRPSFHIPVPSPPPIPAWIAWVVLGMVLNLPRLDRDEKLAWEFVFRFRGVSMSLAYEKFGLRGYVDPVAVDSEDAASALIDDLFGHLRAATPIVEKYMLRDLVSEQLNCGRVTVRNVFGRLRRSYEHFRYRAENPGIPESESAKTSYVESVVVPEESEPIPILGPALEPRIRAWEIRESVEFDTAAAVNAYMSSLEHLMVLAFAFSNLNPANGQLERFIGSTWREKMRGIVDLEERMAKRCYDSLIELVEGVRHPAAHGGFDHERSLIYFHLPGLGAVPVQMSRAGVLDHFLFERGVEPEPGFSAWTVLDTVDSWLAAGSLRFAYQYALSGLDMPFSSEFRHEIRAAAKGDETFEWFLDGYSRHVDNLTNMDW
jgi:hypothetical protein